jgi:hypothetical protein
MTDSNSSLNEIAALLDERRRYESWLVAIEARRESTPQHVFDRVHADYQARLRRVAEQLSAHRSAIDEERANVQSRLAHVAGEERMRRDERAELELRVHVGELNGSDAERAFASVDELIAQLTTEKRKLDDRMGELNVLIAEGARPAPIPVTQPAVPAQAAPAAPVTVQPTTAPVAPPPPAAAVAPAVADPVLAVPLSAAPSAPPAPDVAAQRSAQHPPPLPPPLAPVAAPVPTGNSFDELAFLSSIVGQSAESLLERPRTSNPSIPMPLGIGPDDAQTSLLAGVEKVKLAAGQVPLAANVENPVVLRNASVPEPTKTLKCAECGSMNYPTEWYCERCGAELAAL